MPEMAAYAGERFAIVEQLSKVFEFDRWTEPAGPTFILRGPCCSGAVLGTRGPCDRACALMWHRDWLVLESAPS
jgi:hypothetical protein